MQEEIPYDATFHRAGTVASDGGCSWHGRACPGSPGISLSDGQGDPHSEPGKDRSDSTCPTMSATIAATFQGLQTSNTEGVRPSQVALGDELVNGPLAARSRLSRSQAYRARDETFSRGSQASPVARSSRSTIGGIEVRSATSV
jgi:hypothetical protein